MSFDDKQKRALSAKLSYRHVKTRSAQGAVISYVEGWHAIAEANRIFGFDSWDRQTQSPQCIWSDSQRGQVLCIYSTKVRITVRAGATVTIREGIGTGFGHSASPEIAHEMALKAAETDATKRALATFGNPFGLALYDKDQAKVSKRPKTSKAPARLVGPGRPARLVLRSPSGSEQQFEDTDAFARAALSAIEAVSDLSSLYAYWEQNLQAFMALGERAGGAKPDLSAGITAALKERARSCGGTQVGPDQHGTPIAARRANGAPNELAFPKEKRLRDKGHLAFVAKQPCLVCGRRPAQAHHLRFAQSRAMALKVSDEFTVPLCNTHHDSLHRTGDERAWWNTHAIPDPLKFASRLWAASRAAGPSDDEEAVGADVVSAPEGMNGTSTAADPGNPQPA